ncbi:hypothetical protein WISP_52420 [Willisornis vidua]|uniref:Uncharacterized protein n=1 Tax=Willisornis vidua TaxID=1566151 RepID=A0ABQ9DJ65_9PASS|nr:hypothetical protein WISP_52420 [Willisornis vidua]
MNEMVHLMKSHEEISALPIIYALLAYHIAFPKVHCPKLHTISKVRPLQCRAERDNALPQLAGNAVPDASRTQLALLDARALLTHIQLAIDQDPQGLPSLKTVNGSSQFCIICKLAEYPFQSYMQVIYEDVEEYGAQDGALRNPTSDRSSTITLCASGEQVLSVLTLFCTAMLFRNFKARSGFKETAAAGSTPKKVSQAQQESFGDRSGGNEEKEKALLPQPTILLLTMREDNNTTYDEKGGKMSMPLVEWQY